MTEEGSKANCINRSYGAGDGNRTNPNEPNKGVTTRFSVQLESNGVKSCEGSSQLIRQHFPEENRFVRLYSIRPGQGGVPFESALANEP
jgi:hypothetical protein